MSSTSARGEDQVVSVVVTSLISAGMIHMRQTDRLQSRLPGNSVSVVHCQLQKLIHTTAARYEIRSRVFLGHYNKLLID